MQNSHAKWFLYIKKILSEIKKTLYFFFCQPFRPFSRRAWFIMNWWPTTATCSGCQDPSLNWFRTCCWPTSMWSQPRSQTAGMLPRFPPRRSMVSSMAEGPSMTRALWWCENKQNVIKNIFLHQSNDLRPSSVGALLSYFMYLQGILQALEYLLIKGYTPRRGFYIGLGHDEEVF